MDYRLEIIFAFIITVYFVQQAKPRIRYLFYGYFFFAVTLLMQIPFKLGQIYIKQFLPTGSAIPYFTLSIVMIIITEVSKYYSLKSFVNTRSIKDGILFGIGWATFESIEYFSLFIFNFIFTYFLIDFDYTVLLTQQGIIVNFFYFFIFNLSITALVIISIIKNNKFYLIQAIIYSILVLYTITYLEDTTRFFLLLGFLIYSLFVIFKSRHLK